VTRDADGNIRFQILHPRGLPDVNVVGVHMEAAFAAYKRWADKHPDATEEGLDAARTVAINDPTHWVKSTEGIPDDDRIMLFEIDDEYRIVGPSPGPLPEDE
jgi:hypothetical protein